MRKYKMQRTAIILFCRGFSLLLGLLTAHLAQGQNVNIWNGQNAYGFFVAADPSDPSGCKMVEVSVSANFGRVKAPPSYDYSYKDDFLFVTQFDNCTNTTIKAFQHSQSLSQAEFKVSDVSARLQFTALAQDQITGTWYTLTIDLTWSATGPATTQSGNQHVHAPHSNFLISWNGEYRPADVTGKVFDGITNYTPEPAFTGNFGAGRQMIMFSN